MFLGQQHCITKKDILNYVNPIDIYSTYLGEPISLGPRIKSPFRKEKNPSFGFFKGQTEVCWKDFTTGETGDFVDFIKNLFSGFTVFDALSKVATDFKLPKTKEFFYKTMDGQLTKTIELSDEERNLLLARASANIKVKIRDWNSHDADFWSNRGVSYGTLSFYNVKPISHIFINENIITADNLAYAFLEVKDENPTYKIYQPFNTKGLKWLSSHDNSVWQGWLQLPDKGDELFITKSLKDVMALATVMRIPSVAMQSENALPKESIVKELQNRFNMIYILYDNDFDKEINIGKLMGDRVKNHFKDHFSFQVEIPDKYQAKDFSDLVLKYGREKAKKILEENLKPF